MKINFETIVIFLIVGFACLFLLRGIISGNKKKNCCKSGCDLTPPKK